MPGSSRAYVGDTGGHTEMEETHLTQEHRSLGGTLRKMGSHTKNWEYVRGVMRDYGKANGVR